MKIFAIADIHEREEFFSRISEKDAAGAFDVLLLAGDILYSRARRKWLESLTRPTILIPGNWDGGPLFDEPLSNVNIRKLRFGFESISGADFLCIGTYPLNRVEEAFALARDSDRSKLVLVTHYNPFDIRGDSIDENSGYPEILELLRKLRPAYHVFGHDHQGAGSWQFGTTMCLNVSSALGEDGTFFEI